MKETLADALAHLAHDDPDRVLVVDGELRLTAAMLQKRASVLAQALRGRMDRDSVVTFMLPNWHEAVEIYLATTMAGMIANPVLPSLRDHELSFLLNDVESRIVFIPDQFRGFDFSAMLSRVTQEAFSPPEVVVVRGNEKCGHTAYADLFLEPWVAPLPPVHADCVQLIMYTSGTTSMPKGVLHTHNTMHALIRQLGQHWCVEPGDKFLVPSPISHIGGSIYTFEMPILLGSTAVLVEAWKPSEALDVMVSEKVTHMAGATPFLQGLLDAAIAADRSIPNLKVFVCGGASVPPPLIRKAAAQFGRAAVTRAYGSTEVPVATVGVVDRTKGELAAETDGRPGAAEVRLGENGEIRLLGPQMFVGYHRRRGDDEAFDEEGYFRSGDQGRWVDQDHLVVTGRIKDIIIRNGENIAPKEVEDILMQHPAICEIAVVGIPDERTGERACAAIVPSGADNPDVGMLAFFLQQRGIAKFKIPEMVVILDHLPKNDAGKIMKRVIRDQIVGA